MLMMYSIALGHSKQILCFLSTTRIWLLSALNIPLFRLYSSTISWLFLHTDRLSKAHACVSSAIKSAQTSRLCYFCLKRKEQA